MSEPLDLIAVINEERKRQGMTVTDLAETVGLDRTHLSRILNRRLDPGSKVAGTLMAALGLSVWARDGVDRLLRAIAVQNAVNGCRCECRRPTIDPDSLTSKCLECGLPHTTTIHGDTDE